MQDVLTGDRLDLIGRECFYCHRASVGGHKLDLVRRTVHVDENDGSDVAGDQAVDRQLLPQGGQVEFLKWCATHEVSSLREAKGCLVSFPREARFILLFEFLVS